MQTDSLLTEGDRDVLHRWATEKDSTERARRFARELARLEQENQRLQTRVDTLDCAHKLALGEMEWLTKDNQRLRENKEGLEEIARSWRADWNVERNALAAARAEVQRLRGELEANPATEDVIAERTKLRAEVADMGTEIERLTKLHKATEDCANYWRDQYAARNEAAFTHAHDLAIARNQLEKLRAEAEKAQAQRDEWQRALDHLEEENARLRNTLRLSLILNEPGQADRVLERIATLEGRVQGISEIVKQELAIVVKRVQELEADTRSARETFFYGVGYDPQNKQPVDTARNPFEDLRPPRGL